VRERGSLEKRECVCEKKRSEEVDGERKRERHTDNARRDR
jgi:hypothetical protein